jgi:hypothetical protein
MEMTPWEAFFIKKWTLISIFSILVVELITLVGLFIYSSLQRGLLWVSVDQRELWKYGPTAGMPPYEDSILARD